MMHSEARLTHSERLAGLWSRVYGLMGSNCSNNRTFCCDKSHIWTTCESGPVFAWLNITMMHIQETGKTSPLGATCSHTDRRMFMTFPVLFYLSDNNPVSITSFPPPPSIYLLMGCHGKPWMSISFSFVTCPSGCPVEFSICLFFLLLSVVIWWPAHMSVCWCASRVQKYDSSAEPTPVGAPLFPYHGFSLTLLLPPPAPPPLLPASLCYILTLVIFLLPVFPSHGSSTCN